MRRHTHPFKCKQCSNSYEYKSSLIRHMGICTGKGPLEKGSHAGKIPEQCRICNIKFDPGTTTVESLKAGFETNCYYLDSFKFNDF